MAQATQAKASANPSLVTGLKRWAPSPTVRIAMGLVSMLLGLLMILDLILKILPDQRAVTMDVREQVSVHLAVQVRRMLNETQDAAHLQNVLVELVEQSGDIT